MALKDTNKAIGKVTQLLRDRLQTQAGIDVTVGRPEPPQNSTLPKPRLNLFLYQARFDGSMRNLPLDSGMKPPLWLVLSYLLTAFDDTGETDTVDALDVLGVGLAALQRQSFLQINGGAVPAAIANALKDNPEVLKITFDEAPADLLSQIMQGSDERYRFSMAFQVRPVMIAPGEPPSYSLLVGVDYTASPAAIIGEAGINIPVLPSMGPAIDEVTPDRFAPDTQVTITGRDLHLDDLFIRFGTVDFVPTPGGPEQMSVTLDAASLSTPNSAAGDVPLAVVLPLAGGRQRTSNTLVVKLMPVLTAVDNSGLVQVGGPAQVAGTLDFTGVLLGRAADDIIVALVKDGVVAYLFDDGFTTAANQTTLTLTIPTASPVAADTYRLILRVNGQQAQNSPEVSITA
jgi:hypothetical protein